MSKSKKQIKKVDESFIKKGAKRIKKKDIEKVTRKADDIEKKVRECGPLKRYIDDVKLLLSLVKDYWSGDYKEIPYWAIGATVFALLYVLSPIDLIPDFIPVVGLVDDAAVVALCLYMIEQELHDYSEWKTQNASTS